METQRTTRQNSHASQKNAKKKTRNMLILTIEVIVLVVMLGVLWFVTRATDDETGIQRVEIPDEDIHMNDDIDEKLAKYRTIALFGLDSTVGSLDLNTRSDTIMIASVNTETKEVRLMSVYRDTYLNLGNDTYNKCNAAYAKGGPKQAMSMLNMNFDLNITDFVAVGFKGVTDVVDAIGGVYIDVDSAELAHINNYQISISENLKTTYTPVTKTGYQLLDGLQATAYCRIRYTAGDDFKRTERQREVLSAILEQAQKLDASKLTKISNNVFGNVYTSIDLSEIVSLLSDLPAYELIDEGGFPSQEFRAGGNISGIGDSVICTDLEAAVADFHSRFFTDVEYEPSETLTKVSNTIYRNTAPYIRK